MQATAANLLSIVNGRKQFVIPIYQRTYSWQIAQCRQLLSDILRISTHDSVPGHFIGSIVYFQESIYTQSAIPQLLVIDGQQRLTTVTLLIAAIADFIESNTVEIDTTATKLRNYYLLNADEDNDLRFKLLLTRRDKETLKNILKKLPLGEHPSQRIVENFEFFKEQISTENVLAVYNGVLRLLVVDVALEKDKDNPQLIFESLNSTGLDLSQADLIRNFILMGQEIEIQTDLYEKFWYPMEKSFGNEYASKFDLFMRDFLSMRMGRIPRIDRVYEEFKSYVQNGEHDKKIDEVLSDIYTFSKYYANMVLHKESDLELLEAFRNISKLKVDVSYPFLLPIYDDFTNERLAKNDFAQILSLVENYVFRRAICGIPTNSMNKTFANLYRSVKPDSYVESVQAAFQMMEGYQRFPKDAEFENEILTKDVYNLRSRNYLLSKLENFQRKESVNVEEYTIEHVMPQNPNLSPEWREMLGDNWKEVQIKLLHTLGNLTLTGYNSELSDNPFSIKKTIKGGFNDSPIRLNEYLRNSDSWNENKIGTRAIQLALKAKQVWQAPDLSEDILEKYAKPKKEDEVIYGLEIYEYLTGEMLGLFNALQKRILNIHSSVRQECKKRYIAFKAVTNFVDIVPQRSQLRLSLNVDIKEIVDPLGIAKDVAGLGHIGNGDVEVALKQSSEIDYAIDLIQQAFEAQT